MKKAESVNELWKRLADEDPDGLRQALIEARGELRPDEWRRLMTNDYAQCAAEPPDKKEAQ